MRGWCIHRPHSLTGDGLSSLTWSSKDKVQKREGFFRKATCFPTQQVNGYEVRESNSVTLRRRELGPGTGGISAAGLWLLSADGGLPIRFMVASLTWLLSSLPAVPARGSITHMGTSTGI